MPAYRLAKRATEKEKATVKRMFERDKAELLAFGSLLLEDTPVRLAGQDTRRGTFSQRHSVLVDHVTEQTIIRAIDDAARKTAFVVVDLEGTASMMVVYAISRADLVIIPTSASLLDAVEAVSAVQLVQRQEEAFRIKIPSAVLFTKTSAAIRTRTLTSIEDELAQNEVPIFSVRLHEREAFRSIFSFGGTLSNLDPKNVRNIPAAVENAEAFAAEVVNMLQTKRTAVAAVA